MGQASEAGACEDFPRPHPVQMPGSRIAADLFRLLGWRVDFEGLPSRQGVLVIYPHTSNWDFVFLLLAKWAVGFPLKFWIKDSLMKLPLLGVWLRWLGGVPVDRSSPHGMVGSVVDTLQQCRMQNRFFWLAVTPEGTRKRTAGWRSGFYQVAIGAGVPVGICCVNFATRRVLVTQFYRLSGDMQADMQRIARALHGAVGKHPAQAAPIRMMEKK